jgi:anti-sigma B factor antagonist
MTTIIDQVIRIESPSCSPTPPHADSCVTRFARAPTPGDSPQRDDYSSRPGPSPGPEAVVDRKLPNYTLYDLDRLFQAIQIRSRGAMADEQSHLTLVNRGDVSVAEFADRKILEELSIAEIGEELAKLVAETPQIKLVLNFKNVEHLSSAALGMLITLNKQVNEHGGKLKLSDITPQIFEVFKITRLNKLFEIHDTVEQAVSGF